MTATVVYEDEFGAMIDFPTTEGPADFATAYFATRADAKAWLASKA